MKDLILYRCEICGNLICMVKDSGAVPVCCGRPMTRIPVNTKDTGAEKHVPILHREDTAVFVIVGEKPHPMTPQHRIEFIVLQTDRGVYVRRLAAEEFAETRFFVDPEERIEAVYAWCNLHGLWKG